MSTPRTHLGEPAPAVQPVGEAAPPIETSWDLAGLRRDWKFPVDLYVVLARFLAHAAGRLAEFREQLAGDDMAGMQAAAHGLRGSAGMVQAHAFSALLARIEAAAGHRQLDALESLVAQFAVELACCQAAFAAEFGCGEGESGGDACPS